MATGGDLNVKPDHVIIWCDKNMAVKGAYPSDKAVLEDNADLNRPASSTYSAEIDSFICSMDPAFNKKKYEDLVRSPLRMFVDEDECIKCVNDTIQAQKKPFLITSGEKGFFILPRLVERSSDRLPKILSRCTYIFCGQRELHAQWTGPYEQDIEIYDDGKGVFARVLADIGIHYLIKGSNETGNPTAATQYLYWARRLITSATKIDGVNRGDYLSSIQGELSELQAPALDGNDSDVPMSVAAGED